MFNLLKKLEGLLVKLLMLLMALVLGLVTLDPVWIVLQDIISPRCSSSRFPNSWKSSGSSCWFLAGC